MIDAANVDLADLPQSLLDVVEAVGLAAALALVEHAGGTALYVPLNVDEGHDIHTWLGAAGAQQLAAMMGGETIVLPRCLAAIRSVRDRRIRAERERGERINQLALRYRLTERQVYTILAAGEPDPSRQPSLL